MLVTFTPFCHSILMYLPSGKTVFAVFLFFLVFSVSFLKADPGSLRSFDHLFPGFTIAQKQMAFTAFGFKNSFKKNEAPQIVPASYSGINILRTVMEKKPTQLVEAIIVVPYSGRELDKLDAFNAIGRIERISDYLVYSPSRGGKMIPLFEESTRLDDPKRKRPIPDPPPANRLPYSHSMHLCLKDTFFGNTYFRGDFTDSPFGLSYFLTNFTTVWFLVFPVMRAEKFAAVLYIEPLAEGMLIYCMAGIDIPEFLLDRINLAYQIDRRLSIFISWLSDGLKEMR